MKKKNYKEVYKKKLYKMDLRISLLNFNFVMIHIIYKILVVIKNHMNYLKDNVFEFFFKKYNRLFLKNINFHNI